MQPRASVRPAFERASFFLRLRATQASMPGHRTLGSVTVGVPTAAVKSTPAMGLRCPRR